MKPMMKLIRISRIYPVARQCKFQSGLFQNYVLSGYFSRIPSAYKAGICFPFQLVEEVPAESFDIRMDIIITINEK